MMMRTLSQPMVWKIFSMAFSSCATVLAALALLASYCVM